MRIALLGFGHVGKAFSRLLFDQRRGHPFRIVGIHTRSGTACDPRGLSLEPKFHEPAGSLNQFLEEAKPDVAVEITTLNPETGEPAVSHIRAAFARHIHVITANKGPIAHAYATLGAEAKAAQVEFRFESTVMDGAPVFNQFRNNLPGVTVTGFTGVLNSTSTIVAAAMQRGLSMEEGIQEARSKGIAEANSDYDIDGWDSAAKTAAIANVLMNACTSPQRVLRSGLRNLTTEQALEYARAGKSILLVSRASRSKDSVLDLRVQPEIVCRTDLLAAAQGSSNLLLLHTDLMGTLGIISMNPGVEQTAYGLFSDLVDIARSV